MLIETFPPDVVRAVADAKFGSRSFRNVLRRSRFTICAGVTLKRPPFACRTRAAIAAACGDAALVPEKFPNVSTSDVVSPPKKEVLALSVAPISGFRRTSGVARRAPVLSKKTRAGPGEV